MVVAGVLGVWFVASVLFQTPLRRYLGPFRRDPFALVPGWTFFAPNPAQEDAHVVFRSKVHGIWGPWRPLTVAPPGVGLRTIWNPSRYPRKAATDLVNGVRSTLWRVADAPSAVLISTPYLGLLAWVIRQPHETGLEARQFAIVAGEGRDSMAGVPLRIEFVSVAHRVDAGAY